MVAIIFIAFAGGIGLRLIGTLIELFIHKSVFDPIIEHGQKLHPHPVLLATDVPEDHHILQHIESAETLPTYKKRDFI